MDSQTRSQSQSQSQSRPMTLGQENHLQQIKDRFAAMVDGKYRKGQAEHGGDLYDATMLALAEDALREAIDQVVYLVTLVDKLTVMRDTVRRSSWKSPGAIDGE